MPSYFQSRVHESRVKDIRLRTEDVLGWVYSRYRRSCSFRCLSLVWCSRLVYAAVSRRLISDYSGDMGEVEDVELRVREAFGDPPELAHSKTHQTNNYNWARDLRHKD